MLLEFSVENFRSIRDLQVLRLEAEAVQPRYKWLDRNVAEVDERHRVLKTKVVYGANAAGKSNVIMALSLFQWAVMMSGQTDSTAFDHVEPFAFDTICERAPSHFEARILVSGIPYRYGFTATKRDGVVAEWLFGSPGKKEVKYFTREGSNLDLSKTHLKGARKLLGVLDGAEALVGSSNLLLSRLGMLRNKEIALIYEDLLHLRIVNNALSDGIDKYTLEELADAAKREKVLGFLQDAGIDLGQLYVRNAMIDRANHRPGDVSLLGDRVPDTRDALFVKPAAFMKEGEVGFRADTHLSRGTIKMLQLAGTIIDTLDRGEALIIDEFEAQLHTNLSRAIVQRFHSEETNPHNAQLIVATHDTNLLDPKLMRRDQISFVDKDKDGASRIYALSDIKGVRNDASYEKDYLIGKYGGVPVISGL